MAVSKATVAIGLAAALVVGGIGYFVYAGAQKRAQQKHVAALVGDSSEKLREGLTRRATRELVEGIDADARAIKAPRDTLLANAAEQYIVASREIVRRRADADRLLRQAAGSRRALEVHMRSGGRGQAWIKEALALKHRVETDHTDLSAVLKAYDTLLFDMTELNRSLAPRIGEQPLLDAKFILDARKQGQSEAANAQRELERVRRIN